MCGEFGEVLAIIGFVIDFWPLARVRKSKNFPDGKIYTTKTFRTKCVYRDIDDFATNARKPKIFHKILPKLLQYSLKHRNSRKR